MANSATTRMADVLKRGHGVPLSIAFVVITAAIPAVFELILGIRDWNNNDCVVKLSAHAMMSLQLWLVIDGSIGILYTMVTLVSAYRVRAAIEGNEELRLYLANQILHPDAPLDPSMEQKVDQAKRARNELQISCGGFPLVMLILGWWLYSLSDQTSLCPPHLINGMYWIMLFKLWSPLLLLCVLVCVIGCLSRRSQVDAQEGSVELNPPPVQA